MNTWPLFEYLYIEHLFILIFTVSGWVFFSAFASLVGIHTGITNSAIGLKIWVIPASIKNCKSIMKKKEKKHNKILSITKSKLNNLV